MKIMLSILLGFMIVWLCTEPLEAVTITVKLPSYDSGGPIDTAIQTAWATYQFETKTIAELSKYDNQDKLARGFANANTYASNAASLDGYQDYNLFAVMGGLMVSTQMPSYTIDYDYLKNIRYKIEENGDINFGAGIGLSIINAGLNAGFIYPGLYINLKYGYLSLNGKNINSDLEGFFYKTSIYGIGINQIIIWPRPMMRGLLRWRGIGIGTGFYYNKTETSISILKSSLSTTTSMGDTLTLDPSFKAKIETTTMTVPLNVTTSIKFFQIMNFNLGTGADLNFGSSEIKLQANGSITTSLGPAPDPGYIIIEGGTKKKKPELFNPKITTGLGFNFGPVKIDIPVAIYYLESGFSIGISAGVVI